MSRYLKTALLLFLVILTPFTLVSCAPAVNEKLCSVFERPFSANLTVRSDDIEYRASVSLSFLPTEDTSDGGASEGENTHQRDGSVLFTYPETISSISAVRSGGIVRVNVSGVDVVVSENISYRYMMLADLFDLRFSDVLEYSEGEYEAKDAAVVVYEKGDARVEVFIDKKTGKPLAATTEELDVVFDSFIYV